MNWMEDLLALLDKYPELRYLFSIGKKGKNCCVLPACLFTQKHMLSDPISSIFLSCGQHMANCAQIYSETL